MRGGWLGAVFLWGQAAFYGAAMLDVWLPKASPLKRLTAPVRSFVVMLAAAACATVIFVRPATSLWQPTNKMEKTGLEKAGGGNAC